MVRRSEGGKAGEGGKVLCGNVLGGAWMVTAPVGTRQWWMVASSGVVWMVRG